MQDEAETLWIELIFTVLSCEIFVKVHVLKSDLNFKNNILVFCS